MAATGRPGQSDTSRRASDAAGGVAGTVVIAQRVRVYLSVGDSSHHQPMYVRILEVLRREGAAGAGVFRGIAGFGASGHLHTAALPDVPKTTLVRDVMTPASEVDCVRPETGLHEVAALLLREGRRAVPVVDAQ